MKKLLVSMGHLFLTVISYQSANAGPVELKVEVKAKKFIEDKAKRQIRILDPMFVSKVKKFGTKTYYPAIMDDRNRAGPLDKGLTTAGTSNRNTAQFICDFFKFGKALDALHSTQIVRPPQVTSFHTLRIDGLDHLKNPKLYYFRYHQYFSVDLYRTVVCRSENPNKPDPWL